MKLIASVRLAEIYTKKKKISASFFTYESFTRSLKKSGGHTIPACKSASLFYESHHGGS